jgi:hypothetical protein
MESSYDLEILLRSSIEQLPHPFEVLFDSTLNVDDNFHVRFDLLNPFVGPRVQNLQSALAAAAVIGAIGAQTGAEIMNLLCWYRSTPIVE